MSFKHFFLMKYILFLLMCGMAFGIGGQILDGGNPVEIATPFDETDVAALQWAAPALPNDVLRPGHEESGLS